MNRSFIFGILLAAVIILLSVTAFFGVWATLPLTTAATDCHLAVDGRIELADTSAHSIVAAAYEEAAAIVAREGNNGLSEEEVGYACAHMLLGKAVDDAMQPMQQ